MAKIPADGELDQLVVGAIRSCVHRQVDKTAAHGEDQVWLSGDGPEVDVVDVSVLLQGLRERPTLAPVLR